MAKNDLILLDGIIEEYIAQKLPSEDRGEVFEYLATEQILKDYAFSKDQILSSSVDGRNDGGLMSSLCLLTVTLRKRSRQIFGQSQMQN